MSSNLLSRKYLPNVFPPLEACKLKIWVSLIQQYDDKTDDPLPLDLPPGSRRHVPVTHDECCFHANDREKASWLKDGEQQLRQKSRGRLIHVSDFSTEEHGRLVLSPAAIEANRQLPLEQQLTITDARKIIEPGKNHDRWWDMEQLCDQVSMHFEIFIAINALINI